MSRRIDLVLPPNGEQLISKVLEVLKKDLQNHFRPALSYPNATVRIQWSSSFYCRPNNFEGQTDVVIKTEGESVTKLEDEGLQAEMQMSSIEIGVPSGHSPALTNPGQPTSLATNPISTEARGRRDVNARRGVGIDFQAGAPLNESLANVDGRSVAGQVSRALSDVPKSTTSTESLTPTADSKGDALTQGMDKAIAENRALLETEVK